MILKGEDVAECMIEGTVCVETQTQPNGFDMTLAEVYGIVQEENGAIDFDNSKRKLPTKKLIPFDHSGAVHLNKGAYVVKFAQKVKIPMDVIAFVKPRSSLVRCLCDLGTGIFDAGYVGFGEVMLNVDNVHGVKLYKDARIAQMYMQRMESEATEGYSGAYQEAE